MMDISKDFYRQIHTLVGNLDLVVEKLDTLDAETERQYTAIKSQIRDFKDITHDIRLACDHVRTDVERLSRDLVQVGMFGNQGRQQVQTNLPQPQQLNWNPEQFAQTLAQNLSQAIGQAISGAFKQAFSPNSGVYAAPAPMGTQLPQS